MSNRQLSTDVKAKAGDVRNTLMALRPQLEMALPKHLTPDRLVRVVMSAVQNNPKLLECERTSFLSAIMTCAQLGLEPDGVLGQAYLIPFKVRNVMKCQFIPGYKGLISLARNSGEVSSIMAQAVYEKDHFDYAFGLNERLDHKPYEGDDRGEITHFWAIAKFKDGGCHWDVMTTSQVNRIRDNSQGYKTAKAFPKNGVIRSPWVDHYEEMGKKTAIRRIAKYLPMDVQKAAYIADSYDTGKTTNLEHGEIVVFDPDTLEHDEPQMIEGNASKLDQFAAEPPHDADTGEVVEPDTNETPAQIALRKLEATQTRGDFQALLGEMPEDIRKEIGGERLADMADRFED